MRALFILLLTTGSLSASADVFPDAPHVYVEGSAEIRVEPDTLELSLVIEATDPQLAAAKASVDERTRKLISACKLLGIADKDLTSASLQIGPAYEYQGEERKFLGTRVHRKIDVILRSLDRYPDLIQALVESPIGEIESTTLSSSQRAAALEQAQQRALADARARAQRLAAASGQTLGPAYSISELDPRADRGYSTIRVAGRSRDYEPFEPGMIEVKVNVYVIYLLEDD